MIFARLIFLLSAALLAGCSIEPVAEACRPKAGSVEQMFAPQHSKECREAGQS
jgi:uncharacterized lipoprotein YajG